MSAAAGIRVKCPHCDQLFDIEVPVGTRGYDMALAGWADHAPEVCAEVRRQDEETINTLAAETAPAGEPEHRSENPTIREAVGRVLNGRTIRTPGETYDVIEAVTAEVRAALAAEPNVPELSDYAKRNASALGRALDRAEDDATALRAERDALRDKLEEARSIAESSGAATGPRADVDDDREFKANPAAPRAGDTGCACGFPDAPYVHHRADSGLTCDEHGAEAADTVPRAPVEALLGALDGVLLPVELDTPVAEVRHHLAAAPRPDEGGDMTS